MMIKNSFYIIGVLSLTVATSFAQGINPDSTRLATSELDHVRTVLLKDLHAPGKDKTVTLEKMLELGMWSEVSLALPKQDSKSVGYKLVTADYLILNNRFKEAELLVTEVLKQRPKLEKALLLQAYLDMQAWRLPQAAEKCITALKAMPESIALQLLLGRVRLLQKNYSEALSIAKKVLSKDPRHAKAYLLEADVHFWDQHPELAEAPLKKSLEIDPFNADARFSYGYAIWRRVDATQLNAMAAQWDLALAVNPLHFQTHWHWGNGHTNLTYADYAEKKDEEVRKELAGADVLFRQNKLEEALAYTQKVQQRHPTSILPAMHRASIYYAAFDVPGRGRLDSAEAIFRRVLMKKKHYGPAHNGLSAVIKSQRIPYLSSYDSISNRLAQLKITDMKNFTQVFPDVSYYPGETAKAMVWNQLYTSVVYFPFLSKQENAFKIPPLHHDLAISMNSPYFRFMTTFDNRQWMDIRGVGSGAAAMEYVERGAYQERNVLLHEYVHLFHGRVLTDKENRQIRALYYQAMKEKRTLDYYSQNNESEYLAQTYPAYFEPVKVHPIDFKSMNTTNDLKTKDPGMYEFLDKLIKKERAYLAGDKNAMASNWSEVYLNMSDKISKKDKHKALAYLDSALVYDQNYLPVYLAYASLKIQDNDYRAADEWLSKAKHVDLAYAPIYVAYAELSAAKFKAGHITQVTAVKEQADFLQQSYKLEDDYQELARVNMLMREMYKSNSLFAEAIETAGEYAKTGARVSTYLRDRIDDANAFAAVLKSSLGYDEPIAVLKNLVDRKPQNFEYRKMYADALAANKKYKEAIATLQEAQRILAASGNSRADYNLRIATYHTILGETDAASLVMKPFLTGEQKVEDKDVLGYVRLLVLSGNVDRASSVLKNTPMQHSAFEQAEHHHVQAALWKVKGKVAESMAAYELAIHKNPYLFAAYQELSDLYQQNGEADKGKSLQNSWNSLAVKPGPAYGVKL